MPSLCSRSWKSKSAANGRAWGQEVNIAVKDHVKLKTEAPGGPFCVPFLASAPPRLPCPLSSLPLSGRLLQGLVLKRGASEREGTLESISLLAPCFFFFFFFQREKIKPRGVARPPRSRPARRRNAGPEHSQVSPRGNSELALWGRSPGSESPPCSPAV